MVLRSFIATRPDLVLFGHLNFAPLGLLMRALRPEARLVSLAHGIEAWEDIPALTASALRRFDAIWSVSTYTKRMLVKQVHLTAEKVALLPNALPQEQFDCLSSDLGNSLLSGRTGTSILSVSRLEVGDRRKGIDTMIHAMVQVLKRVPGAIYTVVGSGRDVVRLMALADHLGVSEHVHFAGRLDESALGRAYQNCDVFALPSAKEGFGIVFLEAMAAGKPVIAARAGGVPEVVSDGITGVLIDYGDAVALADVLVGLLKDAGRRRRLGVCGRRRVATHFTFEHYVKRLAELAAPLFGTDFEDMPALATATHGRRHELGN
jgi:glycosyltransferase involved in cell wall biosynthesis